MRINRENEKVILDTFDSLYPATTFKVDSTEYMILDYKKKVVNLSTGRISNFIDCLLFSEQIEF